MPARSTSRPTRAIQANATSESGWATYISIATRRWPSLT